MKDDRGVDKEPPETKIDAERPSLESQMATLDSRNLTVELADLEKSERQRLMRALLARDG